MTKKSYSLDLSKTLYSLDKRNKTLYNDFTEEQKKSFSPLVYMKFMSSAPNSDSYFSLLTTNEFVNTNFWDLSKEPELQCKLLSLCGLNTKVYHKWLGNKKSNSTSNLRSFVREIFSKSNWFLNNFEMNLFLNNLTEQELSELCDEYGKTKEDKKKIVDEFKKIDM